MRDVMRLMTRIQFNAGWHAPATLALAAAAACWWLAPELDAWVPTILSQPLLWLLPAACVLASRDARASLGRLRGDILLLGLMVGLLQIALRMLAGVFFGFGYSPYPHDLASILYYFPFVFGILAAHELVRWRVATALTARYGEGVALLAGWGLLAAVAFTPGAYLRLASGATAFEWAGRAWFPMTAAGLFATYLALRSGPLAAFAYLGIMAAFEWYFPILPSIPWPVEALVGVGVPVLGVGLLEQSDIRSASADAPDDSIAWGPIAGAFAMVVLVWFNAGVFGVRPAIVHGHSMEPTMYTGDLVLSEQVEPDDLEVGDIIRFRAGSLVVLHRIIEITFDDEGRQIFITQGDNNSAADSPVYPEDVDGRLVAHVPKVGWPVVVLKRAIAGLAGGQLSLSTAWLALLAVPALIGLTGLPTLRRDEPAVSHRDGHCGVPPQTPADPPDSRPEMPELLRSRARIPLFFAGFSLLRPKGKER